MVADPSKMDLFLKNVGVARPTYDHWDKIRYLEPPAGLSPEEYWSVISIGRKRMRRPLQLLDKNGSHFSWCEISNFQRAFHEIDSNCHGMIGGSSAHLSGEAGERFLFRSLLEEPFWSSVIEGAATTRAIARQLIENRIAPRTKDERMVLNNYRALEFVRENRNAVLSPEFVFELHRIVTNQTLERPDRVGVFRAEDDAVDVIDNEGNILHVPPHARELPKRLERLCTFANRDPAKGEFIHPIVEAIILHFMLAYDHPFWDGNGRCARALFYWSALRHGYWLLEYVSISTIIRKAPAQYGRAFLYTETDDSDLTYFIDYHLRVLGLAIKELNAYLQRQAQEAETLANRIPSLRGDFNHRQIQLLVDAMKRKGQRFTIAEHERIHGVSYLTARADLEDLASRGFMRKSKDGQRSIYRATSDLSRQLGGKGKLKSAAG